MPLLLPLLLLPPRRWRERRGRRRRRRRPSLLLLLRTRRAVGRRRREFFLSFGEVKGLSALVATPGSASWGGRPFFSKRMQRTLPAPFSYSSRRAFTFPLPLKPTVDVRETCRSVERQNGTGERRCEGGEDDVAAASTDAAADGNDVDRATKVRPRASAAPVSTPSSRRDPLLHRARSESASMRGACVIAQRREGGQLFSPVQGATCAERNWGGKNSFSPPLFLANLLVKFALLSTFNKMLRASASTSRQAAMCSIVCSRSSASTTVVAPPSRALPKRRRRCSHISTPVGVVGGVVIASAASSPDSPSSSFESSLNETQANDTLIDQLLACKGPKEVSESRF